MQTSHFWHGKPCRLIVPLFFLSFFLLFSSAGYAQGLLGASLTPLAGVGSIPTGATHPIINHFPVPKVRDPNGASDYWFPIGWAMYVYDHAANRPSIGECSKEIVNDDFDDDWTAGYIDTVTDIAANNPWNCIVCFNRPGVSDSSIRTVNSSDYLKCLEKADNPTQPLKIIHQWLECRDSSSTDMWAYPAGINWPSNLVYNASDQYLRDSDDDLEDMIDDVYNHQDVDQLAGWLVADEPYHGEGFWNTSDDEVSYDPNNPPPSGDDYWYWQDPDTQVYHDLTDEGSPCPYSSVDDQNRIGDDQFHRIKYINTRYSNEWNKDSNGNDISDVPIYSVVRHAAGYWKDDTETHNLHCRISDVLSDDNYLFNDADVAYVTPTTRWRDMTMDAVKNLLQSTVTPKPMAYMMWVDGMGYPIPPETQGGDWTAWKPDEGELRYAVYTSLIHGARGIMFWHLSRSEPDTYNYALRVARDVDTMAPFLMTEHPFDVDDIYMTSSTGDTTDLSFLVRINPNNSDEALLIICNDSDNSFPAIWVHFPSSFDIDHAHPINFTYMWSYEIDQQENKIGIGADEWWARAFLVHK